VSLTHVAFSGYTFFLGRVPLTRWPVAG